MAEKFHRNRKKVVDNYGLLCYIVKVRCGEHTVPCKLNNVRRTITPWTINGLFKRCKSKQPTKFLSKFASTNYSEIDLSNREVV